MPNKTSPHGGSIHEGSISRGTLREQDLLRAFADELERIAPFNTIATVHGARTCADCLDYDETTAKDKEEAGEIITELTDHLSEIAAREGTGLYFGAHEGDASDFGFWRYEEDADEGDDSAEAE